MHHLSKLFLALLVSSTPLVAADQLPKGANEISRALEQSTELFKSYGIDQKQNSSNQYAPVYFETGILLGLKHGVFIDKQCGDREFMIGFSSSGQPVPLFQVIEAVKAARAVVAHSADANYQEIITMVMRIDHRRFNSIFVAYETAAAQADRPGDGLAKGLPGLHGMFNKKH